MEGRKLRSPHDEKRSKHGSMSIFSKEELQRGLDTRVIGKKVFVFESIDSTNACAKTLGDAGTEEGAVVVADFQTQGRGRHGRAWVADPGTNLLFSTLLRPTLSKETATLLTFYAAVAIARALETTTGASIECKWPNDLLLNGKKCCGILLESSFQQNGIAYSVVGAGINVNQQAFPEEIAERVTSLAREFAGEYDRKQLLQKILGEMDTLYLDAAKGEFRQVLDEWLSRCRMFGQTVTVEQHNEQISGKALRLNEDGGLVLETEKGEKTVYAGDVTVLG
jgi:BirA family biotin operon repressor/biotin-[acetyl-CoA-carboxylase] ligase